MRALAALELEGLGDHRDRQARRADWPGWRSPAPRRSRAAAEARRDEHQVAPVSASRIRSVSSSAAAADVGIRAGAEPLVNCRPDLNLGRRRIGRQRLLVRVRDDELDRPEARPNHAIDGIAASAADADDLDLGAGASGLLIQQEPQLVLGLWTDRASMRDLASFSANERLTN
jgi:hypothetical protein